MTAGPEAELAALRARILAGCRRADNLALLRMLRYRRNSLARMEEHAMPATIVDRQRAMVAATEEVVHERYGYVPR